MFVIERLTADGAWKRGVDYFWNQGPALAVARRQVDRYKMTHRVVAYPDDSIVIETIAYVPPEPVVVDAAALVKEIWG